MKVHLLVEGPADRAFFRVDQASWGQRFFKQFKDCDVEVHAHGGRGTLPEGEALKQPPPARSRGLLDQLPAKLRAYAAAKQPAPLVVVLIDADDDDCVDLKRRISDAAQSEAPGVPVLVRIAVEETEAFYLGDWKAIKKAYPRAKQMVFRTYEPDVRPTQGTWELFAEVVGEKGYENKVDWAERMGVVMSINAAGNRSPSFKALCRGLTHKLQPKNVTVPAPAPAAKPKKKKFHHAAKSAKS
nr:DUF4276 family protein [Deltaproteobacteria bacterium]